MRRYDRFQTQERDITHEFVQHQVEMLTKQRDALVVRAEKEATRASKLQEQLEIITKRDTKYEIRFHVRI